MNVVDLLLLLIAVACFATGALRPVTPDTPSRAVELVAAGLFFSALVPLLDMFRAVFF